MSAREITFRGKRQHDGRWIFGAYIPADRTYWRAPSIADCNHRFEIRPQTLGQYTGFDDINGLHIYEDDIVEVFDRGAELHIMIVRFGEYEGCIYGNENYGFYMEFTQKNKTKIYRNDFLHWHRLGVKIIGNVFDNPELLREGKE